MQRRIGLVGKSNTKGLGTLTAGYVKHLPIHKLLIIEDALTTRKYKVATYTKMVTPDVASRFLDGLDVVILLETPHPAILGLAKTKGVKTILKVNYEFLPESLPFEPDLYLCSSNLNYDNVASSNKILLPDPVDSSLIPARFRKRAMSFLHNAGMVGPGDPNCTKVFLDAIPLMETKPTIYINKGRAVLPQLPDNVIVNERRDTWSELYGEGDVFVQPQRFRATSLPIQEALVAGMPVLTTNKAPFDSFCQFLIEPDGYETISLSRQVVSAIISPKVLAEKMDELYGTDIMMDSAAARAYGMQMSWKNLKEQYEKVILQV